MIAPDTPARQAVTAYTNGDATPEVSASIESVLDGLEYKPRHVIKAYFGIRQPPQSLSEIGRHRKMTEQQVTELCNEFLNKVASAITPQPV